VKDDLLREQKAFLAEKLHGKTLMVSGSTGLIGSAVVRYLLDLNDSCGAEITVLALYRDERKRKAVWAQNRDDLHFLVYNESQGVSGDEEIDYAIHAAGISGGSRMHLKDPIRVFTVGIEGTRKLLDYAVSHGCKGFCYVSTYEIYGAVNSDELIREDHECRLDPMILRNSYAEVKRACESMLTAYSAAYPINVYSGRLTSTFGTGVAYSDPRFFAEFGRCAAEGRDIVLKSTGSTVRNYLDADDAASAFLYILACGENNNAYNLTNTDNAVSIRDIAEKVIRLSGGGIELRFEIADDIKALGFRKEGCTLVDASKLEALGWKPVYSMDDTILKMLNSLRLSAL